MEVDKKRRLTQTHSTNWANIWLQNKQFCSNVKYCDYSIIGRPITRKFVKSHWHISMTYDLTSTANPSEGETFYNLYLLFWVSICIVVLSQICNMLYLEHLVHMIKNNFLIIVECRMTKNVFAGQNTQQTKQPTRGGLLLLYSNTE